MFFKHTPLTYIAQQKLFLHSCNLRVLYRVGYGMELFCDCLTDIIFPTVTELHSLAQGGQRHLAMVNIGNPTRCPT